MVVPCGHEAKLIDQGPAHKTYRLDRIPSDEDRLSNPDLPLDASIEVVLHEEILANGKAQRTVSSRQAHVIPAVELYSHRYFGEFDIRDVKVTMQTENIRGNSVEMVRKERMTSVVAYNLVAQFHRQAAKEANVKPRSVSFKGVWAKFRSRFPLKELRSYEEWRALFAWALLCAGKRELPGRKNPRTCPRRAHPK